MRNVIKMLATDKVVYGAMYLLPDGRLLDVSNYESGHAAIYPYLMERANNDFLKRTGAEAYLWDCGWICLDTKAGYIQTPKKITEAQMDRLVEIKKLYPNMRAEFAIPNS